MPRYNHTWVFTSVAVSGGVLASLYAVNQTAKRFERVLDPTAAFLQKPGQYIYLTYTNPEEFKKHRLWKEETWMSPNEVPFLKSWMERRVKGFPWRLLEIASSAETVTEKLKAIKILTSLRYLEDSDYQHLAQRCDSETAVLLARDPNTDNRFFLNPPLRKESTEKQHLLNKFHDLFLVLNKKHQHWCLGYFISRVFKDSLFNYWLKDFEYLAFECVVSPLQITDDNIVKLCVESLLHHIMLKDNVHAMVEAKGLEILFDAIRYMPNSFEVKMLAVKILMKVSSERRYLKDMHVTGWLKVLVNWSKECDQRLSSPAASTLANLEGNSVHGSRFKSEVCLLYPLQRKTYTQDVDVIIVHGLLGSAHSSWKQRHADIPANLPISGIIINDSDTVSKVESYCALSSAAIDDIPRSILEKSEDEHLEEEYDFILSDIPVAESQCVSSDTYTVAGTDLRVKQANCSCCRMKSQCWPKDWLPKDHSKLRILGVDYSCRITDWTNWCPFRFTEEKARLSDKGKVIMEQLIECGAGERPIVWIGHSMGGLIIKHILFQAASSESPKHQQFLRNSKSVFFLGTPHFGSPVATLRKYLTPLLPSAETKELEINSPDLLNLHEGFSKVVTEFNIQVVTFIETKATKLTVPPLEWELNCVAPTPSDVGTGVVYEIPVGHVDIAKLSTRLSFIYIKVLDAIKQAATFCEVVNHS